MFVATVIPAVLLALAFAAAGGSKLARATRTIEMADHLGIAPDRYRLIGIAEVLGAGGVLAGLAVAPVGVAAGIGLAALTIGATISHHRAGDGPKAWAPAAGLGALALAYAVLRAITA
jgi:hypothetical protein